MYYSEIKKAYLLLGNAHVVLYIREHCWLYKEAFRRRSFTATLQFSSLSDAALNQLQDASLLLHTHLTQSNRDDELLNTVSFFTVIIWNYCLVQLFVKIPMELIDLAVIFYLR